MSKNLRRTNARVKSVTQQLSRSTDNFIVAAWDDETKQAVVVVEGCAKVLFELLDCSNEKIAMKVYDTLCQTGHP